MEHEEGKEEKGHVESIYECFTKVPMFNALKPLLMIMSIKLCRLYHDRNCSKPENPYSVIPKTYSLSNKGKRTRIPITVSCVYS